ncbi:hypothetical protein JCM10207_005454 [Rhodosporidiobolus poonsookiae]
MPDSDSAHRTPECAVCPNKGLLRCTGCRPESTQRFCSRECMKLIWPGHKGICGKDPSAVYFPPLTADEQAFLRANKDTHVVMQNPTERIPFQQLVRRKGLWTGDIELVDCLGQADCDIAEPIRSYLLALTRLHMTRSSPDDIQMHHNKPWLGMADDHMQIIFVLEPLSAIQSINDPFKELSRIYHQLLIVEWRPSSRAASPPSRLRIHPASSERLFSWHWQGFITQSRLFTLHRRSPFS